MNPFDFVRPATLRSLLIGLSGSLRRQGGAISTSFGSSLNVLSAANGLRFLLSGQKDIAIIAA